MERKQKRQSTIPGIFLFILLTLVIFSIVRKMDPDIVKVLNTLSFHTLILLLLINCVYQILEAMVSEIILKQSEMNLKFSNMLGVTYIGIFAGVAFPFGGKIPMQSLYLYHRGVKPGTGLGLMSAQYLLHKTTVVLMAAFFLLSDWRWIHGALPDISPYLLFAFIVCTAIIMGKLLIYTWERVKNFALGVIQKLPDRGKWKKWKISWCESIETLFMETHLLFRNKKKLFLILITEILKLLALYIVPIFCGSLLGLHPSEKIHLLGLASLMFMLSNALPNIAGMGSIEFSFFLIFSQIYGEMTLSVLLLYRLSTYYGPFALSLIYSICNVQLYRHKLNCISGS